MINEEIQDVLLEVSFKTQSIVSYVVVLKLLIENESASLHAFASTLLSNPLCWVGKAKNGLNHWNNKFELSGNVNPPAMLGWIGARIAYHIQGTNDRIVFCLCQSTKNRVKGMM